MNHAASLKIDDLLWKKCVLFWGKHKKKQAALNAIAAHCVFKINASFYFFAFFLFTFCFFFFSWLLQRVESDILPSEIQQLSKIDIQEVTDEERLSEMPSEKQRETMEKDVVDKIEYLCKQDSPKRRLIDKIDQIERMTDEKFKAVFDAFLQTTGKSQRHNDEQEEFRDEVQKRFNKHEEFIRDYFD